ncbi:glycosyltransferase [Arthrobacter sp. LAPM80]|uniref:glycosyltransferase n=1 Tax=Arthrobacter sp. LAPM80 TaxID=3141788 RepID=UPI00398AA59C
MKIAIDILASTELSGGMRLHATEIIKSWSADYPLDRLIIIGPKWSQTEFRDLKNIKIICWPNENILTRAVGQILITPLVGLLSRTSSVLSLSPIVSLLVPRRRAFCFQHDWRHKKNPDEFPRIQRFYRKLWEVSARHASYNICISAKTEIETKTLVSKTRTIVIPNGGDHARTWNTNEPGEATWVVTFGHHNNKRPELVIKGFAQIPVEIRPDALIILGARGGYAERLLSLAGSYGLSESIRLPGFVEEREYQRLVSGAKVVVLASSDEGFGLPVAEATYFGIPAVVTSDSGLDEIFSGLYTAEPTPEDLGLQLTNALEDVRSKKIRDQGTLNTWSDTVSRTRNLLVHENANV